MNIMVTGGLGFIGSHFIEECINDKKIKKIINVDCETYAANKNLKFDIKKYIFIKENINSKFIRKILSKYDVSHVVNFAAESHVDNSIKNSCKFIKTNINGTHNLLELSLEKNIKKFLHISTDEVYGSLSEKENSFDENSPYRPNSPYSASKASSDMLVRSFRKTYGLNTIITNCSNNFGPRQHKEKMIPVAIDCLLNKKPIPIYGTGKNVRDWIYVKDHVKILKSILYKNHNASHQYLIGGENEISNLDLIFKIKEFFEKIKKEKIEHSLYKQVADRKGHDFRYSINNNSLKKEYKIKLSNFDKSLSDTIKYYIEIKH